MRMRLAGIGLVAGAIGMLGMCGTAQATGLQVDWQGDVRWSKHNFTDLVDPYEAVDLWTEVKAAWFLDEAGDSYGPYVSGLGVWSTADDDKPWPGAFDWQRNAEIRLGAQWYPAARQGDWLKALRLYTYFAAREYTSTPLDELQTEDWRVGFDYYRDNLHKVGDTVIVLAYANCAYRDTNFSLDDYQAILAEFNLKVGPRLPAPPVLARALLLPYGLLEGVVSPRYDERWWENYLRAGAGLRLYLDPNRGGDGFVAELQRRLHFYAEVVRNVAWLGDDAPDVVEETDVRFGCAFSTGGFYNEPR